MHPPSSKTRLFHRGTPSEPPNGSLCCINRLQTPRLTLSARAIIKTASTDNPTAEENLIRECQSYRIPGVASAACFRQLYDEIDNNTIALEWLDTTLAEVNYQRDTDTYPLIKTFLRAALTSCDILAHQNFVNTGMGPGLNELASAHQPRLQTR